MQKNLASNNHLGRNDLKRRALRPLPPPSDHWPPVHLVATEGQIQVHTAPYRGSFSLVLSNALRAAGLGSQVLVAQFLKGGVDQGPNGCVNLCGKLKWLRPDIEICIEASSESPDEMSLEFKAIQDVWSICKDHLINGDMNQMVLDEVGLAIALGYLEEDEVLATLEQRPQSMDVILIGPSIPKRIISIADQVTELRCGF